MSLFKADGLGGGLCPVQVSYLYLAEPAVWHIFWISTY